MVLRPLQDSITVIDYRADDEPIFPTRYDLKEYREQAERVAKSKEAVEYYVDEAKRERASASHATLVKLMAERLRKYGAVPKANCYIDLSARLDGVDYIFEMKSTTEENPHSQVRRGLSQLYEYRYIQNVESPRLVLVIECPLPGKLGWIKDYMLKDRGILLAWDGNGSFSCPNEIIRELPFLN